MNAAAAFNSELITLGLDSRTNNNQIYDFKSLPDERAMLICAVARFLVLSRT